MLEAERTGRILGPNMSRKNMRVLNQEEIAEISGAGIISDIVKDIEEADFVGAYENVVAAVSHVIERVAGAL